MQDCEFLHVRKLAFRPAHRKLRAVRTGTGFWAARAALPDWCMQADLEIS